MLFSVAQLARVALGAALVYELDGADGAFDAAAVLLSGVVQRALFFVEAARCVFVFFAVFVLDDAVAVLFLSAVLFCAGAAVLLVFSGLGLFAVRAAVQLVHASVPYVSHVIFVRDLRGLVP